MWWGLSNVFSIFRDNANATKIDDTIVLTHALMEFGLSTIAYHPGRSSAGRVLATFIIDSRSDPHAKIPVMTKEETILEYEFLLSQNLPTFEKDVNTVLDR